MADLTTRRRLELLKTLAACQQNEPEGIMVPIPRAALDAAILLIAEGAAAATGAGQPAQGGGAPTTGSQS